MKGLPSLKKRLQMGAAKHIEKHEHTPVGLLFRPRRVSKHANARKPSPCARQKRKAKHRNARVARARTRNWPRGK